MTLSAVASQDVASNIFIADLAEADPQVFAAAGQELRRQQTQIELIASENIVSRAVMQAQGTVLTNKYAEGYPGRRYYGGCEYVDVIETLAIDRAKALFDCAWVNVQPHSGSQANQAVFMALMQPGDTFMGLDLNAGGHLTHGKSVNQSGQWFNPVAYTVRTQDQIIDYDGMAEIAAACRPKLIIAGGSAYSRTIDFARFRQVADSVGAYLMVDMAHFAGLVAGGAFPSPLPHAHVVTTTTHKTLRGPRGGMILSNDRKLGRKIDAAVFPGMQGGPLMHVIAAKAVAFGEAMQPEFRTYAARVVEGARALADAVTLAGMQVVAGGTDSHLMVVDLTRKDVTGKAAEDGLERAGITCSRSTIPFDPRPPMLSSGIRIGTPAGTTRGFGPAEFRLVGQMIGAVVDGLSNNGEAGNAEVETRIRQDVLDLTAKFPIYG